jgi:hypothetical protein
MYLPGWVRGAGLLIRGGSPQEPYYLIPRQLVFDAQRTKRQWFKAGTGSY